ncbi:hypothetical protein AAB992_32785 [Burkholderia contaminans]|uniref:hypothetical protein n=1 Tax=Burkholderia contaminans TaxID=488447 RepID=UPI0024176AF5|nr:hypothetical protein [Burkholderia contaminans]WFN15523.1 hypothetical protein LXE92_34720 [Burkholderia contaminans]
MDAIECAVRASHTGKSRKKGGDEQRVARRNAKRSAEHGKERRCLGEAGRRVARPVVGSVYFRDAERIQEPRNSHIVIWSSDLRRRTRRSHDRNGDVAEGLRNDLRESVVHRCYARPALTTIALFDALPCTLPPALRDTYGIRYLRAAAKHHTNRYFARARG